MEMLEIVRGILRDALNLGDRARSLGADTRLLGGIAEFDSMAVVSVMTMVEDELDITIQDDELDASVFATVGSLADFLSQKAGK